MFHALENGLNTEIPLLDFFCLHSEGRTHGLVIPGDVCNEASLPLLQPMLGDVSHEMDRFPFLLAPLGSNTSLGDAVESTFLLV